MPVIQALTATPGNRDVRVHDARLDSLLMANGLAFASDTPKVISEKDVVAIANFLQNNRIALSAADLVIDIAGHVAIIIERELQPGGDWKELRLRLLDFCESTCHVQPHIVKLVRKATTLLPPVDQAPVL